MKSDAQLQKDLIDELHWDPSIGATEIGVAAKKGVVTLTGQVSSFVKKYAVVRAAERVAGVRAIAEAIAVLIPTACGRSDTDMAHAVANSLRWDVQVPDERIKALVHEGWVTLEGDVDWQYQSVAAEGAIRHLTGIRGVTNRLMVKRGVSAPDVKERIESALKRHAEVDARQIRVDVADAHVVLRGQVRSLAERADAEQAAWSAPGVTKVEDELVVQT
jgi:osmotically-inducible protein OsmY